MRNHGLKPSLMWVVVAVVTTMVFAGCESPVGGDEESNPEGETDPVEVAEDGTLTLSVSDVPMDLESTTVGDEDLLFAAFVFEAGTDVLSDAWEENWVAFVTEEVSAGSATGVAFQMGDDTRPDWIGSADTEYDVYPAIYCATAHEDSHPTKDGDPFEYWPIPEYVCNTVDWQTPITYKQDGDHTVTIDFSDFLCSTDVAYATEGAFHLFGLVFENDLMVMVDGRGTLSTFENLSEGDVLVIWADLESPIPGPIPGLSGEIVSYVDEGEQVSIEMAFVANEYEFPDSEASASGTLTYFLSGDPQAEGPDNVAFVVDLTLNEGETSVTVGVDGSVLAFDESGPTSFEGSFTYNGMVHDLQAMVGSGYTLFPTQEEEQIEPPIAE